MGPTSTTGAPLTMPTPDTPAQTPIPDDRVASCLSNKTGTNAQVDNAITVSLICTPGCSECIRKVPQAEQMAVYQQLWSHRKSHAYCNTKQGREVDAPVLVSVCPAVRRGAIMDHTDGQKEGLIDIEMGPPSEAPVERLRQLERLTVAFATASAG